MNRILEIDSLLTPILEDLKTIANDIEMAYICPLSDKKTIEQQNYQGIYRIDISTAGSKKTLDEWITSFQEQWELDTFKKKFTPNLKKKRIAQHRTLPEWMPLYLGKSKVVGKRILQHLELPLDKTTYALKLNARGNMSKYAFRLHTILLPVKNYDLVAPILEATLRDRFQPLIGKQ